MKRGRNHPTMRTFAGPGPVVSGHRRADAQPGPDAGGGERLSGSGREAHFLALGIGKSVIVDLPRDVKDLLVADPKIANAVIRSPQRAYIIGETVGQTNVVFFDADGQQIAAYDIAVKRDLNGVRSALRQTLRGGPDRRRRRRRDADRFGVKSDRGPAGRRCRGTAGRRRRQGRQLHRRPRPRSGDVEGHGRGSATGHHQADGRRSQRQHELRHRGRQFQQRQPVHRDSAARSSPTTARAPRPSPRGCPR